MSSLKPSLQSNWILVYTKSNQERRAKENLKKQGFETFLPLIQSSNIKSKSTKIEPVFPRYIFVQINKDTGNWMSIKSTYGVSKIVMFGENFSFVPNKLIDAIKKRINKKGIYKKSITHVDFEEGDTVTVKQGQFAGIDAVFLSTKSNNRVKLLLKLLNSSVVSELHKSDIGYKEIVKKFKF